MFEALDLKLFALTALASMLVGLSKGGLPSIGGLAVPVLALVMPPFTAATLLLPVFIISDVVGLWLYRRHYDKRNLMILIPAAIIGTVLGYIFATQVSDSAVRFLIGIVGVLACLNSWLRMDRGQPPHPADWPRGLFWGTITGFTSFISHAGAPAYNMYILPQRLDKMTFAGTSTIFFAFVNFIKIPPYWALGQLSWDHSGLMLLYAPFAVAGAMLGLYLTRKLNERHFLLTVQIGLFVISLKLIYDSHLMW